MMKTPSRLTASAARPRCALALAFLLAAGALASAQEQRKVTLTGSVQSDILLPQEDAEIGAADYSEWALTNTYADLQLQSRWVDAGVRFEYLEHPLPGYTDRGFAGWGLPHAYVKGRIGSRLELTAGTFYEQFGSGFVLRTYEERSLGIDGALVGGRAVWRPGRGVTVKALAGKQRRYWSLNDALVTGADAEWNLDELSARMRERGSYLTLGASWVNKHEKAEDIMPDATHRLNLPEYVNAFDVRARYQHAGWNILAEYAQKRQDPSFDNGYSYDLGHVGMLSASWSQRGISALAQVKRSENMSFRSRRSMSGTSSFINHLPAFTLEHTYALAALYPYATHPEGEWAYQAELAYTFKRRTALGGKYGTKVKLNYSHVRNLDQDERYYQDLDIQLEKKFTSVFKLNLMYMNQFYNQTIVEGHGGMIHSDIFVAEGKWQLNKTLTLRAEAQYLTTKQDDGDWAYALAELSILPHWMLTLSDQWNCGATDIHYPQGLVTFNLHSHRLQAGYGRTRAGYNCAGGVCRYVPSTRGFTLSYNYNF